MAHSMNSGSILCQHLAPEVALHTVADPYAQVCRRVRDQELRRAGEDSADVEGGLRGDIYDSTLAVVMLEPGGHAHFEEQRKEMAQPVRQPNERCSEIVREASERCVRGWSAAVRRRRIGSEDTEGGLIVNSAVHVDGRRGMHEEPAVDRAKQRPPTPIPN